MSRSETAGTQYNVQCGDQAGMGNELKARSELCRAFRSIQTMDELGPTCETGSQ